MRVLKREKKRTNNISATINIFVLRLFQFLFSFCFLEFLARLSSLKLSNTGSIILFSIQKQLLSINHKIVVFSDVVNYKCVIKRNFNDCIGIKDKVHVAHTFFLKFSLSIPFHVLALGAPLDIRLILTSCKSYAMCIFPIIDFATIY